MKKSELMDMLGNEVTIYLKNSNLCVTGILKYAFSFSKLYNYHKPNYFYIDNIGFKVSHIRKVIIHQ